MCKLTHHSSASVLIFFCFLNLAHAQLGWQRIFPHATGAGVGRDVIATSDGGFAFVGEVDLPTGAIRHYVRLVKTDHEGQVLWEKTYNEGEIMLEAGYNVHEKPTGGFIIAGYSGIGQTQVYIISTDAQGDIIFNKKYPVTGTNEFGNIVLPLPNGDIFVGCTSISGQAKSPKFMRLSATGSAVWENTITYATVGGDGAVDMVPNDDESFTFLSSSGKDVLLGAISPDGDALWAKKTQFSLYDIPSSLCKAEDGNYIVALTANSATASSPVIFKTNKEGEIKWTKWLPYPSHIVFSVEKTEDGGYILGMAGKPSGTTVPKVYFIKLNSEGEEEWNKWFKGEYNRFVVKPLSDGEGYIGCGTRGQHMLLIRTDLEGGVVSYEVIGDAPAAARIAPNPVFGPTFSVLLAKSATEALQVQVFDVAGKIVAEHFFAPAQTLKVPAPEQAGIYLVGISQAGQQPVYQKIIRAE